LATSSELEVSGTVTPSALTIFDEAFRH
jgi:hypothetical protein